MAFRIHDSVVRGEIDNRIKGIVRGRIWVEGRAEPVVLELRGNAHPDLAGCLLTFVNPHKRIPHQHLDGLRPLQRGTIGDLTASRKVRVFDVPIEEAMAMIRRKEKPPEHMANCMYLEWFSEFNGRVVIESADYELKISAPEWRLTPEEDEKRAEEAAAGMGNFLQKLTAAIDAEKEGQKDPEEDWDEHDYERFMRECDARTDKYMELLEKYGDSEEGQEKIAQEMGWDRDESTGDDEGEWLSVEEMNAMCEDAVNEPPPELDPAREGIDWMRSEDGEIRHPLQHRCFQASMKYWSAVDELDADVSDDQDVAEFVGQFQTTSAKLAGALNGIAEGHEPSEAAFTVAYLKRALDYLHKAQAGLEAASAKRSLPEALVIEARQELFEIREGILKLMDHYRGRE